jgi:hypothetical protein
VIMLNLMRFGIDIPWPSVGGCRKWRHCHVYGLIGDVIMWII